MEILYKKMVDEYPDNKKVDNFMSRLETSVSAQEKKIIDVMFTLK